MALRQITPPVAEPVTLAEAKKHLRVDPDMTDDDDLIASLITSARETVENDTSRQLMAATWRLTQDYFPGYFSHRPHFTESKGLTTASWFAGNVLRFRIGPVTAVNSIAYIDSSGVQQTLDPTQYIVDTESEPARVTPIYGGYWPITQYQINAVTVEFGAGYADADHVPESAKSMIKLRLAWLYQNRMPETYETAAYDALAMQLKIW